jgi:hypothetical protein
LPSGSRAGKRGCSDIRANLARRTYSRFERITYSSPFKPQGGRIRRTINLHRNRPDAPPAPRSCSWLVDFHVKRSRFPFEPCLRRSARRAGRPAWLGLLPDPGSSPDRSGCFRAAGIPRKPAARIPPCGR